MIFLVGFKDHHNSETRELQLMEALCSILRSFPLLGSACLDPRIFVVFIAALALAITVHEFAHAYSAKFFGDTTAQELGRVSLNPLVHLDPWGLVFLLLVGFGWGKPVPVDPLRLGKKTQELYVALAGPMANFLTAFLLGLPYRFAAIQNPALLQTFGYQALNVFIGFNLILLAFNLLPIPPLDGSKIIAVFLPWESRLAFEQLGIPILFGLLVLSSFSGYSIFASLMDPLLQLFGWLTRGTNVFSIFSG